MAKIARPAQGRNSVKKIVKRPAGGDNVRNTGVRAVQQNHKRGYAS